jgi:actin related protein 2/3 complex subunit 1A/1B
MDWHNDSKGDRLLTVSSDRDGYVWTRTRNEWRENFVALRLRRAATCVRWSADGLKFAVGGAEGIVSVGYYEVENDWWVCKHLKSLDGSPVLSLAWHPSGRLLAVATLSGSVEVLTTFLKNVPSNNANPSWLQSDDDSFDENVGSLNYGCWIHSMSFSPSGDTLAMAAHDGKLYLQDFAHNQQHSLSVPGDLPLKRVVFVTEGAIAVSGFGNPIPSLFLRNKSGEWTVEDDFKPTIKNTTASSSATAKAFGGALAKFKALDSQGISINDKQTELKAFELHQAAISEIRVVGGVLASTGYDGKLVLWNLASLLNRVGISCL